MIILSIQADSLQLFQEKLKMIDQEVNLEQAYLEQINLIEVRLDALPSLQVRQATSLISLSKRPLLFNLGSTCHTVTDEKTLKTRREHLTMLACQGAVYLDIEAAQPPSFTRLLKASYPELKIILSYHDYQTAKNHLDEDLNAIFSLLKREEADFFKIAISPSSAVKALHLFNWHRNHPQKKQLITIGMGKQGIAGRQAAFALGSAATYVTTKITTPTATGQQPLEELLQRYRLNQQTSNTALLGLIGNPIEASPSHISHNRALKEAQIDAIYLKMELSKEQLGQAMVHLRQLPFRGLSVTMPLKEAIIKHVDELSFKARAIGAVNTVIFKEGRVWGDNSDASGALDALEQKGLVKGKRLFLLGAGGAAKAIAYEAKERGADVFVFNRDLDRAYELANKFDLKGAQRLDEVAFFVRNSGCDIMINATAYGMPITEESIIENGCCMDICTLPVWTPFLSAAKRKGNKIVYGYEMFIRQATIQFTLWYPDIDAKKIECSLKSALYEEVLPSF